MIKTEPAKPTPSKAKRAEAMEELIAESAEELFPEPVMANFATTEIDGKIDEFFQGIVKKHEERLAYHAAYQRDLRTIKRLGLNCTVKEYRQSKEK